MILAVLLGLPVHLATLGRFDHRLLRWRKLRDRVAIVAVVALGGEFGGRTVTGLGGFGAVVRILGVIVRLNFLLNLQPCL